MWFLAQSALADDWTLRDAVSRSLADNLELRGRSIEAEEADLRLRAAKSRFDPSLSGTLTRLRSQTGADAAEGLDWSVGISQPLPMGGSAALAWGADRAWVGRHLDEEVNASAALSVTQPLLSGAFLAARYGIDTARLGAAGARLGRRAEAEGLAVGVANAYWSLVSAREYARLAHRSVAFAEAQLAQTKERFDEGFAGSGDVLQVERALGVSRQTAVVAEASRAAGVRRLARLLGVPQTPAPDLAPTDRPAVTPPALDPAEVLAAAEGANTTLRLIRLALESARLGARQAVNGALPDLSVAGSVGLSAPGISPFDAPDRAWAVGATLSAPLSPRGPLAEVREARLALDRAELALTAAREDLTVAIEAAVEAVHRDRVRIDLAAQTLAAAEKGLAADEELAAEGRGSTRDVVRSLESLQEAQVGQLDAQIDLQASLLDLHRLQGDVFTWLGVDDPG